MFEQRGNIHLRFISCLLFSILFRELTVIWRSVVGSHLLLSDSSDELCHSFVQRSNIISDSMTILPVFFYFLSLFINLEMVDTSRNRFPSLPKTLDVLNNKHLRNFFMYNVHHHENYGN